MPSVLSRATRALALAVTLGFHACGPSDYEFESPPDEYATLEQGLTDCTTRTDTGYVRGAASPITVVTVDGKPVELDTANAFTAMQDAAARQGVSIVVVSGFRTMTEQRYLYACYTNCNCNNCNLAAQPGYSNHQSGHALDLNTSNSAVFNWLTANAGGFGFRRTVPSEPWHWEWWGGGPGGGACTMTQDNCTELEQRNCGAFGCGCVDHQCNGGACPGPGCSASHTQACGGFGCGCADGACSGAFCPGTGCSAKETYDCAQFGCGCADHQCSGGFCPGSGSTARNVLDCAAYGCHSVDGACSGGFCPGTGCTARQDLDCQAQGQRCELGRCVAASTTATPAPIDGGAPASPPDAGALPAVAPAPVMPVPAPAPGGSLGGVPAPAPSAPDSRTAEAERVVGGCAAVPGGQGFGLLLVALLGARRRRAGLSAR